LTDNAPQTTSDLMDLEIKLFATLVRGPEEVKKLLISKMKKPEAFTFLRNAWKIALDFIAEGNTLDVSSFVLFEGLEEVERGMVDGSQHESPLQTLEEVEHLTRRILETFNKNNLLTLLRQPIDYMTSGRNDYEETLSNVANILEVLAKDSADTDALGLGIGFDSQDIYNKITQISEKRLIKTGFHDFDKFTGGFSRGEQIILACPSSAGKSTMMCQYAINMGLGMEEGEYVNPPNSILFISLEMTEEELWCRILANLTSIPYEKFRMVETMSEEELNLLSTTLADIHRYLTESNCKLTLKAGSEATIAEIKAELASHPYDVVCVDYLNLLAEGKELWSEMGSIARSLKLMAQRRGFVSITAAQLDEESLKIRYSRMVKEHCDIILLWLPEGTANERQEGHIASALTQIRIDKGRSIGVFSYWVNFNFTYMRVTASRPGEDLGLYQPQIPAQSEVAQLPNTLASEVRPLNGVAMQPAPVGTVDATTANMPGNIMNVAMNSVMTTEEEDKVIDAAEENVAIVSASDVKSYGDIEL